MVLKIAKGRKKGCYLFSFGHLYNDCVIFVYAKQLERQALLKFHFRQSYFRKRQKKLIKDQMNKCLQLITSCWVSKPKCKDGRSRWLHYDIKLIHCTIENGAGLNYRGKTDLQKTPCTSTLYWCAIYTNLWKFKVSYCIFFPPCHRDVEWTPKRNSKSSWQKQFFKWYWKLSLNFNYQL